MKEARVQVKVPLVPRPQVKEPEGNAGFGVEKTSLLQRTSELSQKKRYEHLLDGLAQTGVSRASCNAGTHARH
ncbi:hypothetical protein [Paenibacillus sp. 1A_MP2]|uniref:hypothetical protein n=1 Tax=Paenibacillus sp. 1A_MP2 TaxID=3457495 RepID=UPI003FCE07DB